MRTVLVRVAAALLFLLGGLVPRPAYAVGSIRLRVNPEILLADGNSTAIVTADVRDGRGRPVRDGTEVRFTISPAGTIQPIAYTSAGVARATLTSHREPVSAIVQAFSGGETAIARVQMVSRLVEASAGGRIFRLQANYVAYSEDLRLLEATNKATARFKGLTLDANAIQVEINSELLRAFGSVRLANGEKELVGERLVMNLTNLDGYLLAPGRRIYFNGYGLNELPERPKTLGGDFQFLDLSESTLLWVGREAIYIPGVKVQIRGGRAYVGGLRALRLPYHESNLQMAFGETGQYLAAGSEGLIVDIPFFIGMTPTSTTALRIRNGERPGFGYFQQRPGFGLDLERRYGIAGGESEGTITLDQITSGDWGFHWDHTQQLGKQTRLFAQFDAPQHEDLFAQLNLMHRLSFGTAHLNLTGSRLRHHTFGRTLDFSLRTNPLPLWDGRLNLSFETRHTDVQAGQFERAFRRKFAIPEQRHHLFGLRLASTTMRVLPAVGLSHSLSVRQQFGTTSGLAVGWTSNLNATLPNNGHLSLSYQFNEYTGYRSRINSARQVVSGSLTWPLGRLQMGLFGTLGLDEPQETLAGRLSYRLTPSWRLDLLPSHYRFGDFARSDLQFGVARKLGHRELLLYWATRRQRFLIELGASGF